VSQLPTTWDASPESARGFVAKPRNHLDRHEACLVSFSMKLTDSITSFFRRRDFRVWRKRETTFFGKLDGNMVASRKRVIIFDYPKILHATDSVEDATDFLVKVNQDKKPSQAAVYTHDTDHWRKVEVANP
jgi:hypothetical protein